MYLKAPLVFAIHLALFATAAMASDFQMSLHVKSAAQQASSKFTEEQPSSSKPRPRSVFTTTPKETLKISWSATNTTKQTTFQDVLIHCVLVAEKEAGQLGVPSLKDPEQESAVTLDFKPGDVAKGEFSIKLAKPGVYLLRLETQNVLGKHDHDYYAELDLVCK